MAAHNVSCCYNSADMVQALFPLSKNSMGGPNWNNIYNMCQSLECKCFDLRVHSHSIFFSTFVQMSTRKGSTDVHEFDGMFQGSYANFKVTSVIGHVLRLCFADNFAIWSLRVLVHAHFCIYSDMMDQCKIDVLFLLIVAISHYNSTGSIHRCSVHAYSYWT